MAILSRPCTIHYRYTLPSRRLPNYPEDLELAPQVRIWMWVPSDRWTYEALEEHTFDVKDFLHLDVPHRNIPTNGRLQHVILEPIYRTFEFQHLVDAFC